MVEPVVTPSSCTVQPAGNLAVRVSWGDEDASLYQIRRNGAWAGSFLDAGDALREGTLEDEWLIRFNSGEGLVDMPCRVDENLATITCSAAASAQGVVLDWDDVAGIDRYQVREHNGDWIATAYTSKFVHAGEGDVSAYDIRFRHRGMVATLVCAP